MADAVVEPAPATHAQDDSKENTNAKAGENKNGSVKDDVETKPDIEEFAEAEKRNLNSNGSHSTSTSIVMIQKLIEAGNSRSRHDGHKSKFANRKHEDFRKNVKTNYDTLPESSDPDEIRKQVEFYFSDSNLAYDDYMSSLVGGSDNHAVPIKIIHSFKRMRRFQPFSAVIAALQDSKVLDLINDAEIRRKVPFEPPKAEDDEFDDPSIPRAIYAKGFGEEGSSTQFDIETFFAPYGPINGVRLRRNLPSRKFKGSVFVEFETEDLQQEFLALEEKPKWSGQDLIYMSKREYCETKVKDIKAGKIQPNKKHQYK
jgi:lupus La protein